MESLSDIKYGVVKRSSFLGDNIVALFPTEEAAEKYVEIIDEDDLEVVKKDEDFYIDIHVETTSSFDVR